MPRLISDENFHGDIVRGLQRRIPALDIIRVQDAGLAGIDDPSLLTFAFEQNRILLTHDRTTITQFVIVDSGLVNQQQESLWSMLAFPSVV